MRGRRWSTGAGIGLVVTLAVACSDGSPATTSPTPSSEGTPTTTVDVATTSSPSDGTRATTAVDSPTILHASVDDASIAGLTIGPTSADGTVMEMTARLGEPSADSGWVGVPESFSCHLYAESRTVWWGDIAVSFGRGPLVANPGSEDADYLEGWSVGAADGFTVPRLGEPSAPRVTVLLSGAVEIGSTEAELSRLVSDSGYWFADGFVHGSSYFPVAVTIEDGRVVGFGVSQFECYDDPSNM